MSMVFCRGCGEKIHETAESCPKCGARQGAQSAGIAVDNAGWGSGMAWTIAIAPLIGAFAEGFVSGIFSYSGDWLIIVTLGVNIVLCTLDEKKLKNDGHDTSKLNTWLVPVYLFNRASLLREKPAYAILWCILFSGQLFA